VINTATNTVVATVPVGDAPQGVAVSPDGTRAYVTNYGADTVSVINTATNTVVATVPVGDAPQGVAVSRDGTRAYVINAGDDTVSVINTATNTVVATVPVGDAPREVAVSPDGTRAYVTNANDDTVSVINTATNTVVATVPVGDLPFGVAIGVVPRPAPVLTLIKLTAGGTFTRGGQGTYTLTVTNTGDLPTDGSTVTVTDTLPAGLTPVSFSGTGWTCTLTPLSCTRSDILAPGAGYPPLTLTVQIARNAPWQVTNTATVTGGGATGTSIATATTTVDRKQQPKHPHHDRPGHDKPDHGKPGHGKPRLDWLNHGHRPGPR
ncbi:beta-propeller fold lactonase family protein, partial [Streptomyces virginiae]|uniref:YVTN family beta-propeller repeat protein n=1 Tax=Streptomyces virginiae TaxID=1961 RepID=UPI00360A8C7E